MAKKNKLIPFSFQPGSWGLVGRPYEEAKAHYELDGEDLERRLIDIRLEDDETARRVAHAKLDLKLKIIDQYQYDIEEAQIKNELTPRRRLEIDHAHNKIDPWEFDCKIAEIDYPDENSLDQQIALLTADYKHGKIDQNEFDKTIATAKNEPWVGILGNGAFKAEEGINGLEIELDWNDQWVEHLRKHGYHGFTDEQVVEQWFSDVCRSQVVDDNTPPDEPVPFNSGRVINRRRGANGGTEYS